jgi:hypothetical protein
VKGGKKTDPCGEGRAIDIWLYVRETRERERERGRDSTKEVSETL